jgi:hypothetical protein
MKSRSLETYEVTASQKIYGLPRGLVSETCTAFGCLVLTVAFFGTLMCFRHRTFIANYDNTYQYFPWMHNVAEGWRQLTPPLWDFAVDSGFPFPGELQTGAFYPVNILFVWLVGIPTALNLNGLVLFHLAFGTWGLSLFLRQRGVSWSASIFGGAIFCWLGPVANRMGGQANIGVGLVYLPWILCLFERGILSRQVTWRSPWLGCSGMALAFSLLGGHPQPFIHNGLFLLLFGGFIFFEMRRSGSCVSPGLRVLGGIAVVAIFTLLFAFIQLASSAEYFSRAYRWVGLPGPVSALQTVPFSAYNLHTLKPSDLTSIFTTTFGIADGGTLFLTITALFCAIAGCSCPGRFRFFALGVGAFSVLVALAHFTPVGWLCYQTPILNKVREPVRILYLYQFCVACLAALGFDWICRSLQFRRIPMQHIVALLLFTTFTVEAWFDRKVVLADRQTALTPDKVYGQSELVSLFRKENQRNGGLFRVYCRPRDVLPPNGGAMLGYSDILGHRSSMLQSYYDFLSKDWSFTSRALDELGVRYVITTDSVMGFPLAFAKDGKNVYSRPEARPIFRVRTSTGEKINPEIIRIDWLLNRVKIALFSSKAGDLIFAQNSYPGWHVNVNHTASPIKRDGIFMSVKVPAGESTVEWYYRPWWAIVGFSLWGVAVSILVLRIYVNWRSGTE